LDLGRTGRKFTAIVLQSADASRFRGRYVVATTTVQ
jgi:hypothetical protein